MSAALILGSCTQTTIENVSGVVSDARSDEPIVDASVRVGDETVSTSVDGRFTFSEVEKEEEVTAEKCGYSPATAAAPAAELKLSLEPVKTKGRLTSNLTGEGIQGSITALGAQQKMKSSRSGRFSLFGLCEKSRVKVSAPGYEPRSVRSDGTEPLELELLAAPATTLEQQIAWQREGLHDKAWTLLHPDARKYITKQELITHFRTLATRGYQIVGVDVKNVVTIEWTFPACQYADFGPKTYPGTAALTVVYEEATPSGGRTSTRAVSHLVQTKDGKWRWFPLAGCDIVAES